jgi:predicted amidohydrolase YtcJ
VSMLTVEPAPHAGRDQRLTHLRHHLENCLADLWAGSDTPVWMTDEDGRIVYANRAAEWCNGSSKRTSVPDRIAAAVAAATDACALLEGSPPIEISPLLDGHGHRLGWLAIAPAA